MYQVSVCSSPHSFLLSFTYNCPTAANMSRRTVSNFSSDEMSYVLMTNDYSVGLDEVGVAAERNLTNSVRTAIRRTYATETAHTLHVLVNDRNWLSDPLSIITEAVEAEGGTMKDFDISKRTFTAWTEEQQELEIFIHGLGEKPQAEVVEEEEEEKEEATAIVVAQPEVVEILDTSDDVDLGDDESESDYEEIPECGLTQMVHQVYGGPAPFELPAL
jgi:hypothetical protein